MMRVSALAILLVCAACSPDKAEEAPDIDYDAMNEAAEGPGAMIQPTPMTFADIERFNLFGAGCNISQGDGLIFIAQPEEGYFLLNGELKRLAPHATRAELPYGMSDHYDGREHSVELQIDLASEKVEAPEVVTFQGSMTIRDAKERVVYEYSGPIQCGA